MGQGPFLLDVRTATPHFPGIGRAAVGLARGFAAAGVGSAVALLHVSPPDPRLVETGLQMVETTASPFGLSQQWTVRRAVARSGALLYHSPYYLMPYAPGVPTVVTCHDLIPLTVPGLFGPAARLAFRVGHALAFAVASRIVVPSAATARDVATCFPHHASKIAVVAHGRDHLAGGRPEPLPAGLADRPIVLSVGSNKPHKNLAVLLEAWPRVEAHRSGRNAAPPRLVLVGPRDARFAPAAQGAPADSGDVVSIGTVSDGVLAALYRAASLFVFPSRAEGFGLPVLEAMSQGAPVVCSRIDAMTELCGDAAAFVPAGDIEALALAIARLLDAPDERERLRTAGLSRAASFSWQRAATEMRSVYEAALGGRP